MKTMNKKGQYGINVVVAVALGLFTLLLIAVAVIAGSQALINSSIFTKDSTSYNQTSGMVSNLSQGVSSFFGNSGTFFSILAVVVIMIFLGLMIGAVYLFTRGKGGAGL
jgi:ABC-type transport system involved in multi-copper enzyme maturation permease subunit